MTVTRKRDKGYLVRMTADDLARLHAEAKAEGITLQALADRKLLGITEPVGRVYRSRHGQEEQLPLTG